MTVKRDANGRIMSGGSSLNPSGRPGLPLETRMKIQKHRSAIYDAMADFADKSIEELEKLKDDPKLTGLQRMAIGLMYKGFNGDKGCFEAVTHPFIGRPTQAHEVAGPEGANLFSGLSKEELVKYGKQALNILEAEGEKEADETGNPKD